LDSADGLPGFLMTSELGSFARDTIVNRKPRIIENVIADNDYPPRVLTRLTRFKEEIVGRTVEPLTEDAPDVDEWNKTWQSFQGRTWLNLPWYFAESYFYRRLLEAVEYFQPGQLKDRDPFVASKREQLKESMTPLSLAIDALAKIEDKQLRFENLLHACLWGNRVDLSNLTVTEEVRRRQGMMERENLLIDDFPKVLKAFSERPPQQIAFINDNVGIELGFDLCLADFLLENNWTERITFYLKPYPFFVSDAMPKDLLETVQALAEAPSSKLRRLGKRLQTAMTSGILILSADQFWASPDHFPEMPSVLHEEISRFDLVISKGDVNYRRLLSDRHWPHTTRIEEIVHYFPTSLLILRTLKGEIMVGLKPGQVEQVEAEDPDWLTNGKRGLIQYIERKHS